MHARRTFCGIVLVLLCLATTLPAQELTFGELAGAAVEPVALEAAGDLNLAVLLDSLADEARVYPAEGAFTLPGEPGLLLLPLVKTGDPGARLFLYYRPGRQEFFFLLLASDALGRPEMRLWSRGPAELQVTHEGATLLPRPSEHTFRVSGLKSLEGAVAEPLTVTESIECIARVLGITVNIANLQSLLTAATCQSDETVALLLTAFNCLSPTEAGVLGCTLGLAKLIDCGDLLCAAPQPKCQEEIKFGQRAFGNWTDSCKSSHREGSYVRYYTFTLTAATTVRIDLISGIDPYLFLLTGNGTSGTVITSDNDGGIGWQSRIERLLQPGTYTIEATTRLSGKPGPFNLSLTRR